MSKVLSAATAVAALFTLGVTAVPIAAQTPGAEAQPPEEQCIARFAEPEATFDQRLAGSEAPEYDQVKSQVDTNRDGVISSDEYIVACREGVFEKKYKDQG